ncbi:hypothetical protein AeMF1_010759 [Aphanomyces euteiches]|nr:hypothetical protein AeMF1_010759 [Aphanomyces euteiches]KAH9192127.1 hypothetical protein AeNC1_005890 [Aphanomyces euteiches]
MAQLNEGVASSLGTAVFWLMVPSITSIMVVAAFVLHHIRQQEGHARGLRKKPSCALDAQDRFGYGLALRDVVHPTTASIDFNSKTPIPIDTPLFQGQAYVLLRRPDGDAHWDPLFEGKQRTIWVMVQGMFKRAPKGTIFVAGELPHPMDLTFWTKALVGMMVSSAKTIMSSLHFSFGDEKEAPHVALPLYQCADTMIVTPLDEVPPKLGTANWGEDPVARAARKRTPFGSEEFRTDRVYSFQFHTMHVDLAAWSIVNLPGIQDVSLNSFLGDMPLRLSVYEHTDAPGSTHASKDYCFSFEVTSAPPTPPPTDKLDFPGIEFDAWMWLEHFDVSTSRRPVSYLVRVLNADGSCKTVVLSSQTVAAILAIDSPNEASSLLTRARREHYQAIEEQTVELNRQLHEIAAHGSCNAKHQLAQGLSTSSLDLADCLTAKELGVNMWRWDLNVCLEGSGYRVLSDTFLRQEYVVLTSTSLLWYRTYSSQPTKTIPIHQITDVTTRYINDIHVVGVHTWTEVVYFQVADPALWKDGIVAATDRSSVVSTTANTPQHLSTWTPFNVVTYEGQIVLNSRKIAPEDLPSVDDPLAVAAQCVAAAIQISTSRAHRVAFQRAIHGLRLVDLAQLNTAEKKLVFLLNLYQSLLVHVSLVLPRRTTTSMHQCAYDVSKLLLSLAEIEHVLLRGSTAPVRDVPYLDFVPEAAAYPSTFQSLALPHRDFRISCALHAHRTNQHLVVYTQDNVHEQLSNVVGIYLRQHVRVSGSVVSLPLVCKWFRADFDDQILRKTMCFLSDETISDIQDVVDHPKFHVEFRDHAVRVSSRWTAMASVA